MIVKRSISIRGHSTSISIEDVFWTELKSIAEADGRPVAALIAAIDAERGEDQNLSSAIRVFVLRHALDRAEPVQNEGSGETPGRP